MFSEVVFLVRDIQFFVLGAGQKLLSTASPLAWPSRSKQLGKQITPTRPKRGLYSLANETSGSRNVEVTVNSSADHREHPIPKQETRPGWASSCFSCFEWVSCTLKSTIPLTYAAVRVSFVRPRPSLLPSRG